MPADPTITSALRAAGEAARIAGCQPGCCGEGTGCEVGPCHCAKVAAAAAIAAFLRALPERDLLATRMSIGFPGTLHRLAAAVEEAARDV
jgi:hypothetical protein